MNISEIKDCIESLIGEFKRANKEKLKEWMESCEGHRKLVQSICLIESKAMLEIANLTGEGGEDEHIQPQDKQGNPVLLSSVFSIGDAEAIVQRDDLEGIVSSRLHQADNDAIEDCIHDLEHENIVGIKDIFLGWFVSKWNERASERRYYNKLVFSIVDNFVYLKLE